MNRSIIVLVVVSLLGCKAGGDRPPEKEPPAKAIDCLERAAACLEENGPPLLYEVEKRGEEKTGEGEEKAGMTNTAVLNGGMLNGVSVNGVELNEVEIVGGLRTVYCAPGDVEGKPDELVKISPGDCACGSGLSLEGTELGAGKLRGERLKGVELLAQLSIGTLVRLRIDDVVGITVRGTELSGYEVSVKTDEGWKPMCGEDNVSIAFPGRWDYNQGYPGAGGRIDDPNAFTFACRGFVLAKCIEDLGYFPWRVPDLHEACVRMLRADFCGDGMSWTTEGVEIQIYDRKQVNREEYGEGVDPARWGVEAEWGTGGALCMRSPANYRNYSDDEPECFCRLESETCGDAFGACEALIITKLETGSAE